LTGTVLLTGATGFVGRQVLRSLRGRGVPVRVVVREGSQDRLEDAAALAGVVTTRDLFAEDARWWAAACEGVDTVLHVAWYAEPGRYLQSPKNLDCLAGTVQLARGAVAAGVRRFVGVGTCFEYELAGGLLSVDTPLRPLSPYAGAKAAAFMALCRFLPQEGVEFAWCRLFYLHGEGEDARRLVPYIRAMLAAGQPAQLTAGNQVRDFLEVTQAARMLVDAALSPAQGALNICSGVPVTVRALAEQIADAHGRRDLLHFGARAENLVDPPRVVGVPTPLQPHQESPHE
jgi:dTDP-6-deoxy-L-talose 4-dehydrogenase (NAD+)